MKRNIIIYITMFLMVYFLFTNMEVLRGSVSNTGCLFLNNVLPNILPMFIISKLLINYNLPYYLSLITHCPYSYIFMSSLLCGSPSSAIIARDMLDKGIIDTENANVYIMCSFFLNPLFLSSMLGSFLTRKTTILIIISSYLSNIILYLLLRKKSYIKIVKTKEERFIKVFIESINASTSVLIMIFMTMVVFNMVSILVPKYLETFRGLLEVTGGLNYLKTLGQSKVSIVLSLIYINFGGLCILTQIKEILEGSKIMFSNFLISRFYHIICSIILYLVLSLIF
mgnify:FL=1